MSGKLLSSVMVLLFSFATFSPICSATHSPEENFPSDEPVFYNSLRIMQGQEESSFEGEEIEVVGKQRFHPKRYNIYVSDEKRFVWFRVFKVASGTIKDALQSKVEDLTQIRPPQLPRRYNSYYKFAFVRNSWDRVLSCYFHKVLTKEASEFKECFDKDFGYFIRYIEKLDLENANSHVKLQNVLIPVNKCAFIGRVDNFAEDFKYVCDQIGIEFDTSALQCKHKTDHGYYSEYYEPWMVEVIAKKYKADIDAFGFKFERK